MRARAGWYNAPLETAGVVMRFTIRDMLWLMVLVAMGFAWWAERGQRDREWKTTNRYETMTRPKEGGPFYIYHHEHREKKGSRLDAHNRPVPGD